MAIDSSKVDLQCDETERFRGVFPATHRLSVPEMDTATDLVEVLGQENERGEPTYNG